MYYIQRQDKQTKQLETVDEFTTRKEARAMLYEYSLSDLYAGYYISTRSCHSRDKVDTRNVALWHVRSLQNTR